MGGLLEDIRVLDFGRVLASAYCGTLLADMGAEVIKIERPGGEFDRRLGPIAPDGRAIAYELISPRNKKSVTLDTRHPDGKVLLDRLVSKAQVVITGFTPKGAELFNLSYDRLKKINPGLIHIAISGYGQNGTYANRPAFDSIAQAESGAMSYTGFPEGPPTRSGVPYVDFSTGMLGALGAVLALRHLEKTGEGQMVDVSLLRSALFMVAGSGVMAEYTLNREIRTPIGNNSFYNYSDAFQAKDGWVMINGIGNEIWQRLVGIAGKEEWLGDPRFKDDASRYEHRHIVAPVIQAWVARFTLDEVVETLERNRVPCGRINTARDVMQDPVWRDLEMIFDVEYPGLGKVPMPGVALRMTRTPGAIREKAPPLGRHNREIYGELLHCTAEEIDILKENSVI